MVKREGEMEGERSIVSFIPAFQNTPDYFSRCLYCDNVLIVVHFWKIARHECAFKIAGVSGSSSPLILRDPLCRDFVRRSAGIDATPNTARDFPSRVRLFRFLKGFRGFFNELILWPPH